MQETLRTQEQVRTATLEALAAVRCQLTGDEAGFVALILGTQDAAGLVAQLAALCANIVEVTCGNDWPRVLSTLAAFAIEQAPER